jgi:hypothetical protein
MKRDDPRITDLRAYKRDKQRARDRARRTPPPTPQGSQGFLGSRPKAGLILAAVVAAMLALWVLPALL